MQKLNFDKMKLFTKQFYNMQAEVQQVREVEEQAEVDELRPFKMMGDFL